MQVMATLCHHILVWPDTNKKPNKEKGENKHTQGHTLGEGSNTAPCGNQGSPSQDPRDHMAQAEWHNDSPLITSKQTTTTPRRNESGEKKGETKSETRANVRVANVKRTVRQPGGCAQSPLSSAFPIIILLGNSLRLALVVLAG